MQIGELARRTGVSLRSLRYYEAKGLLSAQRLENGYRSYREEDVVRVHLIQEFLSMGLTTDEIYESGLHTLSVSGQHFVESIGDDCLPLALVFYELKLREIEQKLAVLDQAKAKLSQVTARLYHRALSSPRLMEQISLVRNGKVTIPHAERHNSRRNGYHVESSHYHRQYTPKS